MAWLLATCLAGLWISDVSLFEGGVTAAFLRQSPAPAAIPAAARSFAVYATGTTCGAISMGGGAFVDSFNSSQGTYAETRVQGQATVGVTGNINLSGSKTIIHGRIFALNTNVGSCKNGTPGITLSGGAQVTEGYVRLPSAPEFPTPAAVSPGSQDYNVSADLSLTPGSYGRIAVSGGATLSLSAGTYTINSLSLSGGSILATAPSGQVIVKIAGVKVSQPVNLSGATLQNLSGIPLNFQLIYGGSQSIVLSGGTMAYGVIYAPNAGVKLSGGGAWFGAMAVKTLDNSGGSPLHYDRALIVPPTITTTVSPAPNSNGWHNTNVAVSFTCSGPLGIASCPSPVTVTTEGRSQVVSGTVTDTAGNTATASITLSIDKTAPVVTAAATPAANGNGWNNTPVVVSFAATDALSGVNPASVTAPITVSADGTNLSASGQAADLAGNVGTVTRTGINIDRIVPTISATVSPAANAGGWNNTPVTAHFTCVDSGSGVATCEPDAVLSAEGAKQRASGTAADRAGNTATTTSSAVNIDVTPPVVAVVSPPNGSVVTVPGVTLAGTVSDTLSGVASVACNGQPATVSGGNFQCGLTLTPGLNSISTLAADVAGNTSASPWALTFTPTSQQVLTLSGIQPVSGTVVAQSPVTVRGTVSDPTARVVVQSTIASVIGTTFEARNVVLSEGGNQVRVQATTIGGAQASATLNLTLDSIPPALTVFSPPDRSLFTATSATVSATASDATAFTCSIDGAPVAVQNGLLSSSVTLASGSNAIAVSCLDAAGHASTRTLTLFQDSAPLVISAVDPADGATQVPATAPVRVTFSEPVAPATATASTMILRAGSSILPVDVTLSPDGLVATATPRAPWPQGTSIVTTVTSGVQDQTGNPIAVPFIAAFTTAGTPLPPGVVVGEVYDDGRSLPLQGATVEALDRATRQVLATTQSDERGRYLLDPAQDDFLVRIRKGGYTSVERTSVESRGAFAEALDARLTATSASQVVQAALGGTLTTAAGDGVVLPAGAFATDASVSLTAISAQGPVGTLPPGWTPLGIVHLEGPQGLPFSATLRLADRSKAASGRSGVIAYYDSSSTSWVTLAQIVVPAVGSPVEHTDFIRPGQFALLLPDEGSGGPGPATVGEPLPAGSAGEIPSGAQASGTVTPSVGRADDPTPAQGKVDIVGSTALRSGTLLRGDFMEVVTLRAGGVVSPFDTSQDFVAYRTVADASGNSLAASFPIALSRTFAPADVTDGSITVRLSRGTATGRTLLGPAGGGVSSGDGSRVIVPAGALSNMVPVSLRRLDATTFPLSVSANVTFVGGLDLDLSGAVATLPMTLSLSGSGSTVPTGSSVVVAEVRIIKGVDRLVIVALGQVNGSEVTTSQQIAGATLPGVRQSGRYGFYRLDGTVDPVRGTARTDAGRRDGHVAELAGLPFVSVTDAAGAFGLVSRPGSFDLTATAAANGDRARVSGTTGTPLPEIVIGPTSPRVDAITVRLPPLEGDFAGPIALVGRPAPGIDDDSSGQSVGNANGVIEAGERIELTLHVRNDGTIPIQGGFFALDLRGPPGSIPVEPARVPMTFLAPDEPLAVGPFVFSVPAGADPALLRYRLAYANNGGLANVIPFALPLGVEHPNVSPASEITIRFSEPVIRTSLTGAVTLAREDSSGLVPVDASLVVASDNASLILRPLAPLADDTVYRITLTSQIVDADKRPLAEAPYVERLRTLDRTPPPVIAPGQIEASFPDEEGVVTITGSPGSVNPGDEVIGLNATTGFSALATVNADGSFRVLVAADATDELSVLVRDASGNTTTIRGGTLVRRDPITGDVVLTIVGRAGGTVSTRDGIRLVVPEGAVQRGTELAVQRLAEPFQLPADLATDAGVVAAFNARFTVVARVRITTNVPRFTAPITLSLPAPPGAVAGQPYVVWRNRSVTFGGPLADLDRLTGIPLADNPRVTAERLVIVESATVKDQGGQLVLSTDSPPFPGITEGGDFTIGRVDPALVYFAGEVRRDSTTGPLVPGVVVRSLPDAPLNSPFAAVTDTAGRFLVADGSLTGPYQTGATVTSRLNVVDTRHSRVIRREVRGVVGQPAPPGTLVAHLEEPFVLPTTLPPEITDILGDLEPPTVALRISGPTFSNGFSAVGSPLQVTVDAQDNDQVTFVALELDQAAGLAAVALSPARTFDITPASPGLLHFRGQARDRSGNATFEDEWVRVLPAGGGGGGGGGGGTGGPCNFNDPACITLPPPGNEPPPLVWHQCPAFDGSFEAQFGWPMDVGTVRPDTVRLLDPDGVEVDYIFQAANNDSRFVIVPRRYLRLGARYRLELTASLTDARTPAIPFAGTTLQCDVAPPTLLTVIGKPDPNSTTQRADVQAINGETVADVATVGDTLVAVTYPSGSNPGDFGHLHTFQLRFNDDNAFERVDTLGSVTVVGRPQSLAVDGTTAYVANRFLGNIATQKPFFTPVLFPGTPQENIPETLLGCSVSATGVNPQLTSGGGVPSQTLGADPTTTCTGVSMYWDVLPQPPSNLQVFDLGRPDRPTFQGAELLNLVSTDIWNPNAWPNRVEIAPERVDNNGVQVWPRRVAVHNFLSNVEFFSTASRPVSQGVVGQITRYGEVTPRGPDGVYRTADDLENEFLDAAFFERFVVTQVRDGIRIMATDPAEAIEDSRQLGFRPMAGAHGGRLGGVPRFQWGGDQGTDNTTDLAFLTTTDRTLHILDVTNPALPVSLGTLPNTFGNMSFDACRGIAYIHGTRGEFHVVDFNDPLHPEELNRPDDLRLTSTVDTVTGRQLLGRNVSLNGNVNRDRAVYLTSEEGVAVVRIAGASRSRFSGRDTCKLKILPVERTLLPPRGTASLVSSKSGHTYLWEIASDRSGGATITDNGNGTAIYTAGANGGETDIRLSVFNSPPEDDLKTLPSVRLDVTAGGTLIGSNDISFRPPSPTRMVIGQKLELKISASPSAEITSQQWTLNTDHAVRSYRMTLKGGVVDRFNAVDLTDTGTPFSALNIPSLHWLDGVGTGRQEFIEYAVTTGNTPCNGCKVTVEFMVARPDAALDATMADMVHVQQNGTRQRLILGGGATPPAHGIVWNASNVQVPVGGDGQIAFVQLVKTTSLVSTNPNGYNLQPHFGSDGLYVLDGADTDPIYARKQTPVTSGSGTVTHTEQDNPNLILTAPPAEMVLPSAAAYAARDDEFLLYLMYLPNDSSLCDSTSPSCSSIWVPLRRLYWFWTGTASRNGTSAPFQWVLVPGSDRFGSAPSIDVLEPPEWKGEIVCLREAYLGNRQRSSCF